MKKWPKKEYTSATKGRYARKRGIRFEMIVRDELRKLYPAELRTKIQRVPLSGAGVYKGDVVDLNNTDWCYEAKNCEKLAMTSWWRQTKAQAQAFQTPCLVFTSNHRPIYWCLREDDLLSYIKGTPYEDRLAPSKSNTMRLMDKLDKLPQLVYMKITIEEEDLAILPNELYLDIRREIMREENQDESKL